MYMEIAEGEKERDDSCWMLVALLNMMIFHWAMFDSPKGMGKRATMQSITYATRNWRNESHNSERAHQLTCASKWACPRMSIALKSQWFSTPQKERTVHSQSTIET